MKTLLIATIVMLYACSDSSNSSAVDYGDVVDPDTTEQKMLVSYDVLAPDSVVTPYDTGTIYDTLPQVMGPTTVINSGTAWVKPVTPPDTTTYVIPPRPSKEGDMVMCTDGMDNDGDGTVDCQDVDCANYDVCVPPEK